MDVTRMLRFFVLIFGVYLVITSTVAYDSSTNNSEDDSGDYQISKEECTNAANFITVKSICCNFLEATDETTIACVPPRKRYVNTVDRRLKCIQLSLIAECIYEKRNFITSTEQLNMSAVKNFAESFYPNRTEKQIFMIDMYSYCKQEATEMLETSSRDPEMGNIVKDLHKPYFLFVFVCVLHYTKTKCPYYTWMGLDTNGEICEDYAIKCKERYFKNYD